MNRKELETHTELADSSRKILQQAMTKMGLSARAYDRILKVARTIADLAGEQKIDTPHVAEGPFSIEIWIVRFKCLPEIDCSFI